MFIICEGVFDPFPNKARYFSTFPIYYIQDVV